MSHPRRQLPVDPIFGVDIVRQGCYYGASLDTSILKVLEEKNGVCVDGVPRIAGSRLLLGARLLY